MTYDVPSEAPTITKGDYSTGEDIEASSWEDLVKALHWLYSRMDARIPGHIWDPAWDTTTTGSYQQEADSERMNLGDWRPAFRLTRPTDDSSNVLLTTVAHVDDLDVRWTLNRIDTAGGRTQIDQWSSSTTSAGVWLVDVRTLADTDVENSGTRAMLDLEVEAKATEGTGLLRQVSGWASIVGAGNIPSS